MNKKGSLYRGLAVPFAVFVLVASLALAGYISLWGQKNALRQLERMAVTNTDFIEELQLPRSRAMSSKLSTVLGVSVGFYDSEAVKPKLEIEPPTIEIGPLLERAISEGRSTFQFNGHEVAIDSFDDSGMKLVLVRQSRSLLATGLGDAVLIPTVLLTIACVCVACFLAHRIVKPLRILTKWLPHLEAEEGPAPEMPARVFSRGDEIGTLARALAETHQRLRDEKIQRRQSERMATLGRIATSLAHEIRNPATSIRLHADLLAREAELRISDSLGLIRTEVDRINDLVNQWLFVVRPAPPQCGEHDLCELVARVSLSLGAALDHSGARLRVANAKEHFPVFCDHARIEQVLRNLLVNAMQAMPDGGDIDLHLEKADDFAALTIRDSGTGFSENALQHFGEPFFSEREGGMGIGLTLAREVVDAHNGTIFATNTARGGALIRIELPLAHSKTTKPS